ncbi:MAG: prolyl oligopeptidase family serine peptidase [Acidobacteriota bacterium]
MLKSAGVLVALTMMGAMATVACGPRGEGGPMAEPPATAKKPVVDEIHGYRIVDDYRWLEDWSDPAVQAWSEEQNAYAREILDAEPSRQAIQDRVSELLTDASPTYFQLKVNNGVVFAVKAQPPHQQPVLVALPSVDDLTDEMVILDPNVLDPSGATTLDFYVPSPDGSMVAVSLSAGGTEVGTVHVVVTATGEQLEDTIPRVNGGTAGGDVAWTADGKGFFYTRYPAPGERPEEDLQFFQEVWFHTLGTPLNTDQYSIGRDFPRIAETSLASSADGRFVLATVANGDGGQFEHYLRGPAGRWTRITRFEDGVTSAVFGPDDSLYLLSYHEAPRGKVLRLSPDEPTLAEAVTVVPEGEPAVQGVTPTDGALYVLDQIGGPSQVRVLGRDGKLRGTLPAPPLAAISQPVRLAGDTVLYRVETFFDPPAWYRYSPEEGEAVKTALAKDSPADFSDCEVIRATAVSSDGTRVPFSILLRKGTPLDHDNPTLLTGYGGFGISTRPTFYPAAKAWLEQGGVLAVANIRGGGELGEAWHLGGNLTNKQNVFDDFAACAGELIRSGYTRPERLAIEGGSNGGLLMGAMLTQHPELFRAVVCHVGLLDMLRFERFANGQFNVTEYGTVQDEEQFLAIRAYSPYQHVLFGVPYPATLFLTGANDPRVDPANSRKMTAILQADSSSGLPVLLRTSATTGHIGSPLSARVAIATDVYAFLFHELGVEYSAPAASGL